MLSENYIIKFTYFLPRLFVMPDGRLVSVVHQNDPPTLKIERVTMAGKEAPA